MCFIKNNVKKLNHYSDCAIIADINKRIMKNISLIYFCAFNSKVHFLIYCVHPTSLTA